MEYIKRLEMKFNFEKYKNMYLEIKQLVTDGRMDLAEQMLNSLDLGKTNNVEESPNNKNDFDNEKGTVYTKISKNNK